MKSIPKRDYFIHQSKIKLRNLMVQKTEKSEQSSQEISTDVAKKVEQRLEELKPVNLLITRHQVLMNIGGAGNFVPTDVPASQKWCKLQKASRRNEAWSWSESLRLPRKKKNKRRISSQAAEGL